jgi:hypothetical protein
MTTLENTKFTINYVKQHKIDLEALEKDYEYNPEDFEYKYNPFQIKTFQNYNPIYSLFFDLSEKSYNKIALNHECHFLNMNKVIHCENKTEFDKQVFIKYSPLIDPIRYMTGKYKLEMDKVTILPNPFSSEGTLLPKISHYNNTSYVDNFFSFLTSILLQKHGLVNGLDYYGSFLGVQDKFKANISDDLEYLNSSDYFSDKINKLFTVTIENKPDFATFGSRGNKSKLQFDDEAVDVVLDDLDILDPLDTVDPLDPIETPKPETATEKDELVYEKENNSTATSKTSSNSSNNSETNYSVENDEPDNQSETSECSDDWESDSDETNDNDDDPETQHYAFINDFPVQLICLEKCVGTLDELFERDEISKDIGAAALMQVIMSLIAYQKAFHFTHNDLHTNNIMYVNTDKKYLYYCFNKQIYRVPTYGKIFKIIDFGRSIYKFKGHQFFSDSFAPGGDGATQYNCEPYMNEKKPRVDPNYSFDLSRLGASIYDFIIEDDRHPEDFDELQETIHRWCLDDNGKNILYKRTGEERYPNFKLYKMIARTVHLHTPRNQLEFPFFKQFLSNKKIDSNENIMDIDALPQYF